MHPTGTANSTSAMPDTLSQHREITAACRDLFLRKASDYGTSWRVLRPISIVDQIYIKAWRIRQIQQKGVQRISDSVGSEFSGIVNYGIIALIQDTAQDDNDWEWSTDRAAKAYDRELQIIENLMVEKNHDYGEAWRQLSEESLVDLILVKLLRIRQIIANEGATQVSEGADANFRDIVNYAVFALIRHSEAGQ